MRESRETDKGVSYAKYAILLLPDPVRGYTALMPELPGCLSEGDTAAEAVAHLQEAASNWIQAELGQGHTIPDPFLAQVRSTDWHKVQDLVREGALGTGPGTVFEQQFQELGLRYLFHPTQAIRDYCLAYPLALPVVLEAYPHLSRAFPSHRAITLSVKHDPGSGNDTLFVCVITRNMPLQEGEQRLRRFDDSYWLQHCHEPDGSIVFDYQCKEA